MYNKVKALICLTITGLLGFSCADTADLEERLSELEGRVDNLEDLVSAANAELLALSSLVKSDVFIVGYTELENGYTLEISTTESSQTIEVIYGADLPEVLISLDEDGNWLVSIDGGETWSQIEGAENAINPESAVPELTVDSENYWCIRFGEGEYERILDANDNPISATASNMLTGSFRNVEYDEETGYMYFTLASGTVISVPVIDNFYLIVKDFTNEQTIRLNETLVYDVEMSGVKTVHIVDIPGWAITLYDDSLSVTGPSSGTAGEVTVEIYLISTNNLMKTVSLTFTLNPVEINANAVKEYRDFLAGNVDNVLLDFSYAGYEHGETAPPDVAIVENGGEYYASNGYTVYDVTKYGAVPNDGLSDREAFLAALKDAVGAISSDNGNGITFTNNTNARAIVYFPEGEYILHTKDDDIPVNELAELPSGMTFPEGYCTQPINIRASNFILKGAGRDKTKLVMKDPAYPTRDAMYSSPAMLAFRHNTSHASNNLTTITGNSPKGSFSVEVASASGISAGDRVCLYVLNNTQAALESELGSYLTSDSYSATWSIVSEGVEVEDYHEVASVSGNTVTFKEPLMHAVDASWGWQLNKQSGYSNVGVEDLTFVGNAKEDFEHHGSWQDDGAYKPLYFVRLTDSWIRRVGFESVSEALSITSCANVSAYDITISGKRGHSSIRAERSSRVFIGAVTDISSGTISANSAVGTEGDYLEGAGQYHAVGVSKPSIGTVLWRNRWGKDACFEAHATQPRATLVDCCTGGWMQYRQGGDAAQMPNHLADLTIWNFEAMNSWSGTFDWWNFSSSWWKFLPPIIVGFHGYTVNFNQIQVVVDSENGTIVEPESLYEAQLRNRLGYVPAWLNALKS